MTERSKQIFGNDIAPGAYKKAVRSKQKFIRKFGDEIGRASCRERV